MPTGLEAGGHCPRAPPHPGTKAPGDQARSWGSCSREEGSPEVLRLPSADRLLSPWAAAWDRLGQKADATQGRADPAEVLRKHWTEHSEPQGSNNNSYFCSKYTFK